MGLSPREPSRWHYRRSLASRVTLLTTFAVGLTVAVLALGAYVTVRMQMQASLDASLIDRAQRASQAPTLSELTVEMRWPSWAFGAADVRIAFIRQDGKTWSIDDGPVLKLGGDEIDVARGDAHSSIRTIEAGDTRYRVVTVPTRDDGVALVIAQSLDSQETVLGRLGIVMLLFGVAGVIAAGVAGWGVARNGLRPVRRLTSVVEEIGRTEDLTPIEVEGNDEIARLSSAFNTMLAALEASRERQRQLVGDAGHELRTPLTSLRTNLDLLLQADASGGMPPEARAELLDDVGAQIEEMTNLIGDLVELGRDEHAPHQVELVDLKEVLDRAITRVRRRASSIDFDVEAEDWWVTGESAALERAVMNLLDNAAKWSPADGTVTVRLADGVLTVADQGPGISEADLPYVFDRFYRSTESRSMPGSGLGLSIVRQTAVRHSGSAEASTLPDGGACLTLRLPGRTLQQV
ncbi:MULTISPECIES: sensor histidine kinase [unclassified Nocardioides]|uniref:sensor histidine kinase n=1 Tax=unclassified Nocardioides TaxID=2615069 RepID=UPI0006FAC126|nr:MULTISPECIES: HAMP domain-containing sensor histidine kinase [unclassified Nocardioides]KQY57176.1 histidine kinase [Nocardioides sp. Root140]KQZ68689.1 histidine kinase [Nocardioides sp. Root151]KRF11819.1 histidine kinase [Nocardioides sp. Soil796]